MRIWIENFSGISKPLRQLTIKGEEWDWTEDCEAAFQLLKKKVGRDILLTKLEYGENAGELIVAVDSAQTAAGAVLLQVQKDGKRQPARYESISFTDVESRYSQAKLELCGVVKTLKKLQLYIWGVPFTLEVDASYLRQMVNSPDPLPNAATNRWVAWLHLFDFSIRHVPAEKHKGPDALSRVDRDSEDSTTLSAEGLISDHIQVLTEAQEKDDDACIWRIYLEEHLYDGEWLRLGRYLDTLQRPEGLTDQQYTRLKRKAVGYFIRDGKLFKRRKAGNTAVEVVINVDKKKLLLEALHDNLGHRGVSETYRRLMDRAWWPKIYEDVSHWVKSCDECQKRKAKEEREKRTSTRTRGMFERLNFDTIHIGHGPLPYIVTAHDDLMAWPEAKCIPACKAKYIEVFIEEIIARFGQFSIALCDSGPEYFAEAAAAFEKFGVKCVRPSSHSPESNGMSENHHIPLVDCLQKLSKHDPARYHLNLPTALFAERISVARSTGFSPYFLMYGCDPVLPVDLELETWLVADWKNVRTKGDLLAGRVKQIRRKPEDLEAASRKLGRSRKQSVQYHDKANAHRLRDALQPGDMVLVQNVRQELRLGRKLEDRWLGPYKVVERTRKGAYYLRELGEDGVRLKRRFAPKRLRRFWPRRRLEGERSEEYRESMEGDIQPNGMEEDDNWDLEGIEGTAPVVWTQEEEDSLRSESSEPSSSDVDTQHSDLRSPAEPSHESWRQKEYRRHLDEDNIPPELHDPLQDYLEVEGQLPRTRSGKQPAPQIRKGAAVAPAPRNTVPQRRQEPPGGPLRVLPYMPK